MRLKDKCAIVVGAGQSPGEGMGNGRATALRFAAEGARVMAVDRDVASAEETAAMARAAGGDRPLAEITEDAFDRVMAINLRGAVMACKHVVPLMRAQGTGSIILISSLAALEDYPLVAYKASKAAMIAFTRQLALENAGYGVRANVILPGLMDTPMAVDTRARASGRPRAEIAAERDRRVPLRHKMGNAWDVANAALFLASDEAGFITGVALPVDGGGALRGAQHA
jgi:NAD(P)-dependent dehydrogenase (short-subunit alcohol dehydrogenase family)